jgi:hypothetical protein
MKKTLAILLIVLLPVAADAKTETIFANFKYTMGDNDTKNDAKRIAFLEAKRLLVEKAGVFIESETKVVDGMLSHDEIKAFTAAVLKVEVVKEEFQITGETQTVIMTVKSEVDPDEVSRTLSKIHEDKSLQKKIMKQQKDLKELENRIRSLQAELAKVDSEKAIQLRKDRAVAFQQLGELEKIKFTIQAATKSAVDNVERGMTPSEVRKVAGIPRSKDACGRTLSWNYGKVWVMFEGGIVGCIINVNNFTGNCGYYKTFGGHVK